MLCTTLSFAIHDRLLCTAHRRSVAGVDGYAHVSVSLGDVDVPVGLSDATQGVTFLCPTLTSTMLCTLTFAPSSLALAPARTCSSLAPTQTVVHRHRSGATPVFSEV